MEKIIRLALELLDQPTALDYLRTVLRYMAAGTDKLSEAELRTIILKVIEEGDKLMPTLAEQWIEQGREQGEAIGLKRGREEGREEGREAALNVLRRFLATRFGVALDHFDAALQPLDLAALTALSEAAFEAESLAVFETKLAELQAPPETNPSDEAEE